MSTFNYGELATLGQELLLEFGQSLPLLRASGGTYDPVPGTKTGGSVVNLAVQAVQVEWTKQYREGRQVETGDRLYLVDNVTEPLLGDVITIDGANWSVMDVEPIKPAESAIVYLLQVRK